MIKKRNYKNIKGKLLKLIVGMCLMTTIFMGTICVAKYIEQNSTMMQYQLANDVENGNKLAIDYYSRNYVAKGKYLFDENETVYLNMSTITGYETTKEGVLLHTSDGNGYFIENKNVLQ